MAYRKFAMLLVGASVVVGGCASGTVFGEAAAPVTTASLPEKPRVDPVCAGLSSQIATLRQEGVADRIEKAAAKKYKMTAADFAKADQLTKASAEFQAKCSVVKTGATAPSASVPPAVAAAAATVPTASAAAVVRAPAAKAALAPAGAVAVVKPAGQ